eukprot:ctg_285.g187
MATLPDPKNPTTLIVAPPPRLRPHRRALPILTSIPSVSFQVARRGHQSLPALRAAGQRRRGATSAAVLLLPTRLHHADTLAHHAVHGPQHATGRLYRHSLAASASSAVRRRGAVHHHAAGRLHHHAHVRTDARPRRRPPVGGLLSGRHRLQFGELSGGCQCRPERADDRLHHASGGADDPAADESAGRRHRAGRCLGPIHLDGAGGVGAGGTGAGAAADAVRKGVCATTGAGIAVAVGHRGGADQRLHRGAQRVVVAHQRAASVCRFADAARHRTGVGIRGRPSLSLRRAHGPHRGHRSVHAKLGAGCGIGTDAFRRTAQCSRARGHIRLNALHHGQSGGGVLAVVRCAEGGGQAGSGEVTRGRRRRTRSAGDDEGDASRVTGRRRSSPRPPAPPPRPFDAANSRHLRDPSPPARVRQCK